MQDESNPSGWVKLYHPAGPQVTIPLDLNGVIAPDQANSLLQSVTNLMSAGFTVFAPGLEDGEQYEQIGYVVRKEKENPNENPTPVLDLYPVTGNYRLLAKYLNTEDDIVEFEKISGIRLSSLPLWDGDNAIERGKSSKTDKYVAALPRPLKVVWRYNPRYDPEEKDITKKKPRRLFVRWADAPAVSASSVESKKPMPFEKAIHTLTPGGSEIGLLSQTQLSQLAASRAPNVTDDMREAAAIVLAAARETA